MNRAYIQKPDGRVRPVKNLGWLLRNWHSVERLEWVDWDLGIRRDNQVDHYWERLDGDRSMGCRHCNGHYMNHPVKTQAELRARYGGVFRAYMRDGRKFATPYASFEVWKGFINRPVFRGLPVVVNGFSGTV